MTRPYETIYFEEQLFIKTWVKYMVYGICAVQLVTMLSVYFLGGQSTSVADKEALSISIIVSAIVYGSLIFLFNKLSLTTYISQKGVYVQFAPFKTYFLPKEEIADIRIAPFPIFERGHFGVGWSLVYGKTFAMGTKDGIFVNMKSGKRYVISTSEPMNAKKAIDKIKQY